MNQLIIAEKPSVAQSIAAVLGAKQRREGYIEGNSYLVSWCFGHLAELANAETYNIEYAKWRYSDLPIMPQPWRFKVNRDKYKQFEILKTLMRREARGRAYLPYCVPACRMLQAHETPVDLVYGG
jgi:DNA topoisomerase-3